jgi:hypothetical protein
VLLALGILQARQFEGDVAAHLDDPVPFVRDYAAWALVMMESEIRRIDAMRLASGSKSVISLQGNGSHVIAVDRFRAAFSKAEEALARLSASPTLGK